MVQTLAAGQAARQVRGVVAPSTNYGYKSLLRGGGGPHFVGGVGLRGNTLIALVTDIMSQFILDGWRNILVLGWHVENVPFVWEGIDKAVREANQDDLKVVKIDDPYGLGTRGHPDLMAAHPELVREDMIVDGGPPEPADYDILPVPRQAAHESGVFWKATQASREKGERILDAVTGALVEVVQQEFLTT